MGRLTDKIALVTGGGRSFDRSIALPSAREGAKVGVPERNMTMLDCVIAQAAPDNVNAICPGAIETPMFAVVPREAMDCAMRQIPQGRLGWLEDVAALALFPASDEALRITGGDSGINGGRCAS